MIIKEYDRGIWNWISKRSHFYLNVFSGLVIGERNCAFAVGDPFLYGNSAQDLCCVHHRRIQVRLIQA